MPKVKTIRVLKDGSVINEIDFRYDVYVDKEGAFTTTIPEDIAKLLKDSGFDTFKNRLGNIGHYQSSTMDGLSDQIEKDIDRLMSKELVDEVIVLRYSIETICSYCIDQDGEFMPNGSFVKDDLFNKDYEKHGWQNGTIETHATSLGSFGFSAWVQPYVKRLYKFSTGKEYIDYEYVSSFGSGTVELEKYPDFEPGENLLWLIGIGSNEYPRGANLQEINYTEEVAEFFVELFKSIFRINENIKDYLTPEAIKKLAESKTKLIG